SALLLEGEVEQCKRSQPALKRPPGEHRPIQMAVKEPHLRTQGEQGDAARPQPERRPVHGEGKKDEQRNECENELSHWRPPNAPRPARHPMPAPLGRHLSPTQRSSARNFALYGPYGPSTQGLSLELRPARAQFARIVAAPDLRLKCYRAD